jgi:hypothetical protein
MSKEKIKKKEILITYENHDNENVNINYLNIFVFLAEY